MRLKALHPIDFLYIHLFIYYYLIIFTNYFPVLCVHRVCNHIKDVMFMLKIQICHHRNELHFGTVLNFIF